MNDVPVFINGATFWGIGFAIARQKSVVVDPTINPGHEFADTFCSHVCDETALQTELAREFYRSLAAHNAIANGRLHPPALVPLLSAFILDHQLNILLEATLIDDHVTQSGRRQLSVMTTAGLRTYNAEYVFDTLTSRHPIARKEFNAILHSTVGCAIEAELLNQTEFKNTVFSLSPGRFTSEAVLHMTCPPEMDFPEARLQLEQFWRNRPSSLADWRIAAMAQEFFLQEATSTPVAGVDCFSQSFGDPLSALEAGAREALK